jgi:hypothetical protein
MVEQTAERRGDCEVYLYDECDGSWAFIEIGSEAVIGENTSSRRQHLFLKRICTRAPTPAKRRVTRRHRQNSKRARARALPRSARSRDRAMNERASLAASSLSTFKFMSIE